MPIDPQVSKFLYESNAIEDVWDGNSLKQAFEAWNFLLDLEVLTLDDILTAHYLLMRGKLKDEETGKLRQTQVFIGGKEGKPFFALPYLMDEWVEQAMLADDEESIKADHISFEAIHPFIDGNGRMGRLLMNWQRVKANLPILIIWEDQKWSYYAWFK